MRFELRRIQKDLGITAIYVTHDQTEALAIADRIAVMSVGRIAQVGSPREIYQYPRSKFVADFIGEPNILDGRIESISKENGLARVKVDERLTVEGRLPSDFSSYAIGDSVSCFIRPESILGNEQSKQSFEVKVGETSYQGQMELYELKLPDGKVLRAIAFNPIEGLQSGQSLKIQLPAESVLVLKE
jgi:iron(III) transport system ATP-binding protein